MSDSDELGVTYTEISSPFEDLSDIGSPRVVGPEHEGLPWMLDDPYVQEDEVFPAEEKPLPDAASPTAQSPDYVSESDPKANPEEDDDEDPIDYLADEGDDGDDEDEPSDDDEDEEVDIEADDEEEDEHQLLLTPQLLHYQLPIRPHLRRRQSRSRLTSLRPHHHHYNTLCFQVFDDVNKCTIYF
ncbi:hypothetical protein Tco_0165829, partial [Tanacetum coccineum]